MAFTTHWKRFERWKVKTVDATKLKNPLAMQDELRFEGGATGLATDTLIRIDHLTGIESTWGDHCLHSGGPPEKISLKETGTGDEFIIKHVPGVPKIPDQPAKLYCWRKEDVEASEGGPGGEAWVAEEQLPPLP